MKQHVDHHVGRSTFRQDETENIAVKSINIMLKITFRVRRKFVSGGYVFLEEFGFMTSVFFITLCPFILHEVLCRKFYSVKYPGV